MDADSWASNPLAPPAGADGLEHVMRWSPDALYLLTVPQGWCPADLNLDGRLNFFDVSLFLQAYRDQSPWANLTSDPVIDFFDISTFIDLLTNGCD